MSTVPTLYSICFDYIRTHTGEITSLEGIPFNPIIENLIEYLFTSKIQLNQSILSVIPHSHSKALRTANLIWTRLSFNTPDLIMFSVLKTIKRDMPRFITHLNIGATDLCDDDIYLLSGCTNLKALCFEFNQNITDRTVSYIATMTLNISNGRGLPYLEELNFNHVKGITDKSLKFFGKMKYISCLFLSGTQVTADVAKAYLVSQGFQFTPLLVSHWPLPGGPIVSNIKLEELITYVSFMDSVPTINRKVFQTNHSKSIDIERLAFKRASLASTKKRTSSNPIEEKRPFKQQRMVINDFYNMVEAEFADDA
ncbi:hypothetical protein BD770DRAFT_381605 [Pilaira anomala]|nr:hypothetical protein BD770DRAFT_381605 [Pilaira anomala]